MTNGSTIPVLGPDHQDDILCLHVQGAAVDFWVTPAELYHRRGYRLVIAKPPVWDVWGRVMRSGAEGVSEACLRCYLQ